MAWIWRPHCARCYPDLGLDLYDLEMVTGTLNVTVTQSGGVDLESLTRANRAISEWLDENDPIAGHYTLDVSSPGLERKLRTAGALRERPSARSSPCASAARSEPTRRLEGTVLSRRRRHGDPRRRRARRRHRRHRLDRARPHRLQVGRRGQAHAVARQSILINEQERLIMANFDFLEALGQIARDQNIDEGELLVALANALLAAYKRRPDSAEDAEVEINPETGEIKVWGLELDVEGNVTREWDATPDDFGRIAAQTAKQVLMQLIRDIQRRQMYEEFANREGDIVSGTVQQNDNRYTLLDLGRVEALLPQAEQIAFERYEHGARIKVYIVEVRKTNKGPQIVVSRTHPALVAKLFEIEVPEIANGIVEIKALAREPGHRSQDRRGVQRPRWSTPWAPASARAASRVRNITNELRSERIDVVPYSDDPIEFIQAALAPARSARGAPERGGGHRHGHRARPAALAGHRQGGPERPPRRAPHRLAHRHPLGERGRRGRSRRRGLDRGRRRDRRQDRGRGRRAR